MAEAAETYLAWYFKPLSRTAAEERQLQEWGKSVVERRGGWMAARSVRARGVKPGDQIMDLSMYVVRSQLENTLLELVRNPATTAIELTPDGAYTSPTKTVKNRRSGLVFTVPVSAE